MAHFAELDKKNIVTRVIVVNNNDIMVNGVESEQKGIDFCKFIFGENTNWKQTSYNEKFRKNFAGPGYFYDEQKDAFIPPKPNEDFILDTEKCKWYPPVLMRDEDDLVYFWNADKEIWELVFDEYLPISDETVSTIVEILNLQNNDVFSHIRSGDGKLLSALEKYNSSISLIGIDLDNMTDISKINAKIDKINPYFYNLDIHNANSVCICLNYNLSLHIIKNILNQNRNVKIVCLLSDYYAPFDDELPIPTEFKQTVDGKLYYWNIEK